MTNIQWTNETWNPIVGCSRISEGCKNCYAATAAASPRLQQFPQYEKVSQWDGTVQFVESQLLKPLSWRSPKKVFVCSMADLFHKSVPFKWIDKIFAVMAIAKQHTFQILTKRPERMLEYLSDRIDEIEMNISWFYDDLPNSRLSAIDDDWVHSQIASLTWPLQNVWIGTSVENQKAADLRIPFLLQIPATIRFLSCEPLLEEVRLDRITMSRGQASDLEQMMVNLDNLPTIDWVIVGGESGSKARVCHLEWIRSLIIQCQIYDIPIFVKQLGSAATNGHTTLHYVQLKDRKGGNLEEWPEDLRVREFPEIL